MCGIAGFVNLNKEPANSAILESMVNAERHRGPDDAGYLVSGNAALGHARLSIIDLSQLAHQPLANEDSTVFVVHNGEIYNYLELKRDLEALGHKFRSRSDTEVIVHAYEEWGERCLNMFNGMWAFAILDLKKKRLFCSRDRFGVKPFYYYRDNKCFVFASEIKSLLRHPFVKREPNDEAIYNYLASCYGYMDTSDKTFFNGIKQLKASHYLMVPLEVGEPVSVRYWDLDPLKKSAVQDETEVCRIFSNLFYDSVKLRLRSDVPVGVALSGGLDSSSIACVTAALMGKGSFDSFSSCYDDERYDERKFIKPVLEKTGARPNFIFTQPEKLFEEIEQIVWHQDEPYSTLSIFPQWYVMKLAREKGVKVLLVGQGGDEVLGGYHKYYYYLFADLIRSGRWKEAKKEIRLYRELKGNSPVVAQVAKIIASNTAPRFAKEALRAAAPSPTPSFMSRDFIGYRADKAVAVKKFGSILNNDLYNALKISPLPSLLHIDDRSSMAHSVESRSPFLDYRLVEFLFSLGPEYKIRDGMTKYLLRTSLKGVLPEEVRMRRDKMGFATPLEQWLKTSLKDKVNEIFCSKEFRSRRYFINKEVMKTYNDFVQGRSRYKHSHFMVWSWINLELWMRKFID